MVGGSKVMLTRGRRRLLLLLAAFGLLAASLTACSASTPRTYLLHAPPCAAKCAPRPLVLVLHGVASTAAQAEASTNFDHYADLDHFVVAYPQGLPTNVTAVSNIAEGAWNAGTATGPMQCCAAANADDLTWLASLPKAINARTPINLKRVYIAGFSNGGMMAFKAVCERPDVFAAAEVVSGALLVPCSKTVVHVIHAHDLTGDCFVPYVGGYTCGGLPTAFIPAKFPDSADTSALVAAGSVVRFVDISSGHAWPTATAAAFGWAFLKQWRLA
jgi:poly(3-hydroxybutyrate) depolymerase